MTTTSRIGTNNLTVRLSNRAAIFRIIYDSAPIARVDLVARTGLNAKTVSVIVDELVTNGLARELGYRTTSGAGRKAVELEIDPTARYAIGIDIAHPTITAALVDLVGHPHRQVTEPRVATTWDVAETVPTAARAAEQLIAAIPPGLRSKIIGVGIGAPRRLMTENGRTMALSSSHTAEWVDLGATELEQQLGLPVTLDHNANTSALGELWFGTGKDISDFVLLNLSAGIGMGIVVNGEIYVGGNHHAGDINHITVNSDGPRCTCGNAGCLVLYLSRKRMLSDVQARLKAGEPSTLPSNINLSLDDITTAFRAGDPLAAAVFSDAIGYLTTALISIINTYDPQLILLGRVFAAAGEPFLHQLRTEVGRRLPPARAEQIRIEPVAATNAPLIGAAALALREFFRAPLSQPAPAGTAIATATGAR